MSQPMIAAIFTVVWSVREEQGHFKEPKTPQHNEHSPRADKQSQIYDTLITQHTRTHYTDKCQQGQPLLEGVWMGGGEGKRRMREKREILRKGGRNRKKKNKQTNIRPW